MEEMQQQLRNATSVVCNIHFSCTHVLCCSPQSWEHVHLFCPKTQCSLARMPLWCCRLDSSFSRKLHLHFQLCQLLVQFCPKGILPLLVVLFLMSFSQLQQKELYPEVKSCHPISLDFKNWLPHLLQTNQPYFQEKSL